MGHGDFETREEQAAETGLYRRADVEGFAEWARSTIDRLQRELVEAQGRAAAAERRALHAERTLAQREELEEILARSADRAATMAGEAAAQVAAERIEILLEQARARPGTGRSSRREMVDDPAPAASSNSFDDPLHDPLPPWSERLLAFPEEQSELPPIGSIFEDDRHRSA